MGRKVERNGVLGRNGEGMGSGKKWGPEGMGSGPEGMGSHLIILVRMATRVTPDNRSDACRGVEWPDR
jgi:hypothetical protein